MFAILSVIASAWSTPLPPFETLKADLTQITWSQSENVEEDAVQSRAQALLDLLKPQVDPYWGTSHISATCDPARLPRPKRFQDSKQKGEILYLYATQHRRFGLCSEKFEILRVQVLLLYCKRERVLYEIRHFQPREKDWTLDPVARCK